MNGSNLFGRIVKAAMIVALYAFFFIGAVVLITGCGEGRAVIPHEDVPHSHLPTLHLTERDIDWANYHLPCGTATTPAICCPPKTPQSTAPYSACRCLSSRLH